MIGLFARLDYWRSKFREARYMRSRAKCDSCDGTFQRDQLHPRSGDWWMCDECFDKFMKAWGDDIAELNEKGSL